MMAELVRFQVSRMNSVITGIRPVLAGPLFQWTRKHGQNAVATVHAKTFQDIQRTEVRALAAEAAAATGEAPDSVAPQLRPAVDNEVKDAFFLERVECVVLLFSGLRDRLMRSEGVEAATFVNTTLTQKTMDY